MEDVLDFACMLYIGGLDLVLLLKGPIVEDVNLDFSLKYHMIEMPDPLRPRD